MMAPTGDPHEAPIVLIIFNRPERTREVFEQIRRQSPRKLFIVSDGPRSEHPADAQKVHACRRTVQQVDWACDVTTIYSQVNLGCRDRIISGLNVVFDQVPSAIIVEDDCLPHDDFFAFATELLHVFARESRIFSIGGHLWEYPDGHVQDSYTLSKYFSSWGWATWADRWKLVDYSLTGWPDLQRTSFLREWADSPMEVVYWERVFDMAHRREPPFADAWDYAVQFSMWRQGMLAVRPSVNLIENHGFDAAATHTRSSFPAVEGRRSRSFPWPIVHPDVLERNRALDAYVNELRVGGALRARLRGGA